MLREVTATMVTGPATGIKSNRFILPHFSFPLQELMENHDGLDHMAFLYAELLFQFAGPYGTVLQELPIIREKII